jgi:AmmeMemoRadiSam system protein B
MDYPKLRTDISVFPVTVDGNNMIFVQDSQRLSQGVFIPRQVFARFVSFFDGGHSIRDIQYEAMRQYGELVYTEQIETVIQELDKALLLESPRLCETLDRLKEEFRKGDLRPAFFSGKSYPEGTDQLRGQLETYFSEPGVPGSTDGEEKTAELRGILAPHIDFQRGGPCYARAYTLLREAPRADVYIILGIAHAPSETRFTVTAKDFETPFGIAQTDKEFVSALSKHCSWDIFQDEFLHRSEHSVEFQVVFLQYVLGLSKHARIVPILCGSFDHYLAQQRPPEDDPMVSEFLDGLKSTVGQSKRRVCFIAGVDLSHIGPQFGDPEPADNVFRSEIRQEDLEVLDKVATLDTGGFFQLLKRNGNKHRICGFPAIYVFLKTIDASHGEILTYDQGPTPDGQSVVSFAAMAFYGPSKGNRPRARQP